MRLILGFICYALGTIGWTVDWPPGAVSLLVTDRQGRRWRVSCEAVEP